MPKSMSRIDGGFRAARLLPLLWVLLLASQLALAQSALQTPAPVATYTNPLPVRVADPFVIFHDGIYYLSGTSSDNGFKMWTSRDLVHWRLRGYAYRRTAKSWGRTFFWAPAMLEHNGKFYFYYSALGPVGGGKDSLRICAAMADSPLGPYRDVAAPMFNLGKATIDVHVFVDTDGQGYVYYSLDCSENRTPAGKPISEIYVLPLNPDLISVRRGAKPILCIRPDQPWEGDIWNEGPFVFKHRNTYIMMYSANGFTDPNYAIGYATSNSPTGPWKKSPDNPVLHKKGPITGTGHNAVIASPDGKELFCVYHVHNPHPGGERLLAIDRMIISDLPDGSIKLRVLGPTWTPQRLPSGSPEPAAVENREIAR